MLSANRIETEVNLIVLCVSSRRSTQLVCRIAINIQLKWLELRIFLSCWCHYRCFLCIVAVNRKNLWVLCWVHWYELNVVNRRALLDGVCMWICHTNRLHTSIKMVFLFAVRFSLQFYRFWSILTLSFFSLSYAQWKEKERRTETWKLRAHECLWQFMVNPKWLLQLQMFIQLMAAEPYHCVRLMLLKSTNAIERCSNDTRFIVH